MKNLLVTGGAGFIGSNYVRYILSHEETVEIFNLDALTYAGSLENLKNLPDSDRHHFIKGDICNADIVSQILNENQIDTIVHFAAESHVDRSIHNPGQFIQTNIIGTFNLLEAARKSWLGDKTQSQDSVRFHHVSTDEVFGALAPNDPPFDESTPYSPRSPYSASKASSDHLVRAYLHTYGLPVTITNCTNNYGPYQFPEKLIPLMILNALNGKPLPIYGDGQQVRDWLYVEDHCEAINLVVKNGRIGETYGIGGNNQPPNLEIVQTICDLLDEFQPHSDASSYSALMQYVTDRPGHDRRYAMNISKIKDELGWQPTKTLRSGLFETVKWYLDHPEWVDAIRKQSDLSTWVNKNYAQR
jgi:dTDP-glucose 4,6-dehydratase